MPRWTMSSQHSRPGTQGPPAYDNLHRPPLAEFRPPASHVDFARHARPSATEMDLRRIFNHLDADGSGLIDVFELAEVSRQLCASRTGR